jgi:hypothetical protein
METQERQVEFYEAAKGRDIKEAKEYWEDYKRRYGK